jgi:2,3-bisphosphoglycerate-dependent phosphoglycerate mutase
LPLSEARNWPLLNCSVNTVEYGDDGAKVIAWGDVSHLATDTDDDDFRKRG